MKGLVEEAAEHIGEHEKGKALDCVLISSAQKVEHYEIAGYGTARTMAKAIGNKEAMNLLQETLKEEEMTDKLLSKVAIQIQKELLQEEGESAEELDEDERRYSSEAQRARSKTGGGMAASRGTGAKKKVAAQGANASQRGGQKPAGRRASATSGRSNNGSSRATTDHDEIRQWAEERGAHPACVRGTGSKGDIGMIRLDFPGYSGGESLEEISWDEFFEKFDEQGLALLVQDSTVRGQKSDFNKLIARETAELAAKGGRGSARRARR
jgi:hypothetical protein